MIKRILKNFLWVIPSVSLAFPTNTVQMAVDISQVGGDWDDFRFSYVDGDYQVLSWNMTDGTTNALDFSGTANRVVFTRFGDLTNSTETLLISTNILINANTNLQFVISQTNSFGDGTMWIELKTYETNTNGIPRTVGRGKAGVKTTTP